MLIPLINKTLQIARYVSSQSLNSSMDELAKEAKAAKDLDEYIKRPQKIQICERQGDKFKHLGFWVMDYETKVTILPNQADNFPYCLERSEIQPFFKELIRKKIVIPRN